jgi:ribosomal protein S18 acetylase RimI-like enzyme
MTQDADSPAVVWELHDDLPPEVKDIDAGLGAANAAAAPLHAVRPLCCFARDAAGSLIGGAVGRTWGDCCELQQLWVDGRHRQRGIGSGLLRRFEACAAQRNCRTFYLETFSFQAPALYRRHGYSVAAEIAGFAPGISKFLMRKRVEPGR